MIGSSSTDDYEEWEARTVDDNLPGTVEVLAGGTGPMDAIHRLKRNLEDLGFGVNRLRVQWIVNLAQDPQPILGRKASK